MISLQKEAPRSARRVWVGYVQRLFEALDLHEREMASEISESLAVFCEQHPHMSGHTLSLLMARSFCATGDRAAADRVLRHDRAHRTHTDSWLEVLSTEYPFPELYPLFSARVLRPLRLNTVGQQAVWVLDLERLHLTDADRHEIILLQTLRALAENVSNVWKKSKGKGTLAVKGLARLNASVCLRDAQHLPDYLREVLSRRATRYGWASAPSVLMLDL